MNDERAILEELRAIASYCPKSPFIKLKFGSKRPEGGKWTFVDSTELSAVIKKSGIGLVFEGSGLCAFDLDAPESAKILAEVIGQDVEDISTACCSSGKNILGTDITRRQLIFRCPEPESLPEHLQEFVVKRQVIGKNYLDYRAGHNYSVLPTLSNHPDTKSPYFWIQKPSDGISQLSVEQIERLYQLTKKEIEHTEGDCNSDKEGLPGWQEIKENWLKRYQEFKKELLTIENLTPSEYCDFVLIPIAGWQKILGYGSKYGFKRIHKGRYVTSAAEYRETSSGESITVDPQRVGGLTIYRAHDRGIQERAYMSAPLLILRRRGIYNPTFAQKVAIVNEIAEEVNAPKYHPHLGEQLTEEEKTEWRQERVLMVEREHAEYNEIDCDIVRVPSMIDAARIIQENPDRIFLIRAPKGSGKSEIVLELKRALKDKTILTISPTKGLAMEQSRKYSTSDYQKPNAISKGHKNGLSITCDSLHKVRGEARDWVPGYTIADECDALFNHINTSDTDVKNHRPETRMAFEHFMKEGNPVLMSADIGGAEVKFVRALTGKDPFVIDVDILPRGTDIWTIKGFANTMAYAMGWLQQAGQEWINSGKKEHAPTVTFFSDTRAAADSAANLLLGDSYTVNNYGDSEEKVLASRMKGGQVDEIITPEVRKLLEVRKITKETVGDQKEIMSNPTLTMIQISNGGRIPVSIASPSVAQGNSYVYPGEHLEVYLLSGNTLDTRGVAQHVRRDRNPQYIIIGDMRKNAVSPIPETAEQIKQGILQLKNVQLEDKDFVNAVKRDANYLRFKEYYFEKVGSRVENATKADIMLNAAILMQEYPEIVTNRMVADFLIQQEQQSAWVDYQIFRMQEKQLDRQDELSSLIRHLVKHDGCTYRGSLEEKADKPIKEMNSTLKVIDDHMKAEWLKRGHDDSDSYGSEENVRDSLKGDAGLNPKEIREYTGALMKHEFPGVSFQKEQYALETTSSPPSAAAKKIMSVLNPEIGKKRMSKRTAARLQAIGHKPEIIDDHYNRQNQLWSELLHQVGYMEFLIEPRWQDSEIGFCNEDPEVEIFLDRCRRKQRTFAKFFNMRVPKKGAYEKYMVFINRIHRKMGLTTKVARYRRAAQMHGEIGTRLQGHYLPNLEWILDLMYAHEQYWITKETKYISKVNHARSLASYLCSGEAAAAALERVLIENNSPRSPESLAGTDFQPIEVPRKKANFGSGLSSVNLTELLHEWNPGTPLTVKATCSNFSGETVTLVDWRYSKEFNILSAIVQTVSGALRVFPPTWLALG